MPKAREHLVPHWEETTHQPTTDPVKALQKHCKSLLLARKALKMAIKETDVDDPEGDIAAVSATTPQDCLRLRVLFMNVDRVIKLLK